MDYLDPQHHSLVRYSLVPVRQAYAYYNPGMRWAEADLEHAGELMREAYRERTNGRPAARRAWRDFSAIAVGHAARERLSELMRRTNPVKWQRVQRQRLAEIGRPAVPIPGAWFDADYFEHGVKSNWSRGYAWRDFGSLFEETAGYVGAMFPEAESFIDMGCAKGFLVRALRQRGKACWGFDHSVWALDHVEDSARDYVRIGSAESIDYERQFDVTLAFSLFESLTEEQLQACLRRARAWTRHALLAVIATRESDAGKAAESDRDLSHITMRPRAWWHALFLNCGWRQEPLHRVAQRACQEHGLVKRMGWQVFVYAP
jgi:hypothetical protein